MHRGPWIAVAVLLALALAGLLALGSSLSSGRPAYVRENIRLVDALPLVPGAHRFDLSTTKTDAGGWRTEAFFSVPAAADVWGFYAQRLPALGWRGGGPPESGSVSWTRGRALLLVFVGAPGRYSLVVDSRAGGS